MAGRKSIKKGQLPFLHPAEESVAGPTLVIILIIRGTWVNDVTPMVRGFPEFVCVCFPPSLPPSRESESGRSI